MNATITVKAPSHYEHMNEESVIDLFNNSHLFFSIGKISIHY